MNFMVMGGIVFALSTPALAGDYYVVGEGEGRSQVSIADTSRIKILENGVRTAWIDNFFSRAENRKMDFDSEKAELQFNCQKQTIKSLRFIYYALDGDIHGDDDMTYKSTEREIIPDSVGEYELKFVCGDTFDPDLKITLREGETVQEWATRYMRPASLTTSKRPKKR